MDVNNDATNPPKSNDKEINPKHSDRRVATKDEIILEFRKWLETDEAVDHREKILGEKKYVKDTIRNLLNKKNHPKFTDWVLYGLVPHTDAAKITGWRSLFGGRMQDIKGYLRTYEHSDEDMDIIANMLFSLAENVTREHKNIDRWIDIFTSDATHSKGLQCGIITPLLFCINDKLPLINGSVKYTYNEFSKVLGWNGNMSTALKDYRNSRSQFKKLRDFLDIGEDDSSEIVVLFCWQYHQRNFPGIKKDHVQRIIDQGCFIPKNDLKKMMRLLHNKKNLILQGPPGTGKTWLAKKLAFALIKSEDKKRMMHIQFHSNISYEDFVRGYRPGTEKTLELIDGHFLSFAKKAGRDMDKNYVCVIEEINRGNPANIFGEVLTLLETTKRGDKLSFIQQSTIESDEEEITLPKNLYVIGTMNLADKSLAMVDMALRRRFAFANLKPLFDDEWTEWCSKHGIRKELLEKIKKQMNALNKEIANDKNLGEQYCIGHSFVMPDGNEKLGSRDADWYDDVIESEIKPLLDEYWFDNPEKLKEEKSKLGSRK